MTKDQVCVSLCLPLYQLHSVLRLAGPGLARRSQQPVGLHASLTTFKGRECCSRAEQGSLDSLDWIGLGHKLNFEPIFVARGIASVDWFK